MSNKNKVTWKMILDDFKQRHPSLRKEVSCSRPYAYATILIYLKNGLVLTYNYDESRAYIIERDKITH